MPEKRDQRIIPETGFKELKNYAWEIPLKEIYVGNVLQRTISEKCSSKIISKKCSSKNYIWEMLFKEQYMIQDLKDYAWEIPLKELYVGNVLQPIISEKCSSQNIPEICSSKNYTWEILFKFLHLWNDLQSVKRARSISQRYTWCKTQITDLHLGWCLWAFVLQIRTPEQRENIKRKYGPWGKQQMENLCRAPLCCSRDLIANVMNRASCVLVFCRSWRNGKSQWRK